MFPIDSPSYKPREELRFVAVTMLLLNLRSRPFLLTTIGPDAADEYVHPFCTEASRLPVGYDTISLTRVQA